ncbi:outer membrane protein assembly factor BamB family protein [Lignipirellula cremea]|uniref:Outer membrane biogenesis protein BamB n=1 Tax=Lignipirellula cremea TaxID=2528010 RepID=A0A518E4Q0_9BACT|nr:PQQ-binding-like beta-propeller repeat protein [Lignipirellula cremea]QDU99059.1 outer membrane biogenesis protein BamB [Lignipirellula cremea]
MLQNLSRAWQVLLSGTACGALALLTAGGSSLQAAELAGAAWPAFQNSGRCTAPAGPLAVKWSPSENVAWEAAIEGYGQSAPIIVDQQVVVTSTAGKNKEQYFLAAFSLTTGEKLWQQEFKNPTPQENSTYVSRAAPTPIADADGFIAFYEGGLVVAVKRDGTVRWQRDLVESNGPIESRHGLAASLEQTADRVFVWVERSEDPYLLSLDKKSGETVWKVDGLGVTSWSSPRLAPTADGDHLVCSGSGKIVGFDPASGKRLWEFTDISNNSSCTPVPVGDGKFLIGASDGRGEENAGNGAASNGLLQIVKQDDGAFALKFVWRSEKASSTFGSPIVAGDQVLIVNRTGVLFRLDLKTGEQRGTTRLGAGGIWATPFVAGEKVYLFGNKGTTSVVSFKDGEEIAENRVWEAAAEDPAAGGRPAFGGHVLYAGSAAPPYLILRRGDALYAVLAPETAK